MSLLKGLRGYSSSVFRSLDSVGRGRLRRSSVGFQYRDFRFKFVCIWSGHK